MNDFSIFRIIAAIALVTVSCAVFTSLPGCGHNSPAELAAANSPQTTNGVPATSLGRAQSLLHEAQVVCAGRAPCPEAVGMIVTASAQGIARCSGSLIAPDLVVTSGRCIPADLATGAACAERLSFVMPALNNGALPAHENSCSQITLSAPLSDPSSIAFVRLSAPVKGRQPLELQATGLADGESFSVAVVEPTSDIQPLGEIRVQTCKAYQRTVVFPRFRSDSSATAALGSCRVGASGTGAPVLDQRGALHAVIQNGLSQPDIRALQQTYGSLLGNTQVADFACASNWACVLSPEKGGIVSVPEACTQDSKMSVPDSALERVVSPDALGDAQVELSRQLTSWLGGSQSGLANRIRWAFAPLAVTPTQQLRPLPTCFAAPSQWLGAYHHWIGGYSTDAQMDIQVPRFRVDFDLSAVLQTQVVVRELGSDWVKVRFNARDLAQGGQSSAAITLTVDGSAIGGKVVLKACPL